MSIMIVCSVLGEVARRFLGRVVAPTAVVVATAGNVLVPASEVQAQTLPTLGSASTAAFADLDLLFTQTAGIDLIQVVNSGLSATASATVSTQSFVNDLYQPLSRPLTSVFLDPSDNATGDATAARAFVTSDPVVPMSFSFSAAAVAQNRYPTPSYVPTNLNAGANLSSNNSLGDFATLIVPTGSQVTVQMDARVRVSSDCYSIDQLPAVVGCPPSDSSLRGAAFAGFLNNDTGELTLGAINETTSGVYNLSRNFVLNGGTYGFLAGVTAQAFQGGGDVYGLSAAPTISPVPEPGTWALMLGGVGILGALARRRSGQSAAGVPALGAC